MSLSKLNLRYPLKWIERWKNCTQNLLKHMEFLYQSTQLVQHLKTIKGLLLSLTIQLQSLIN
jgi:hypothetical protein